MSTLYRVELMDTGISQLTGIGMWTTEGEPVTVDGVSMVRMRHGTIIPADGFCASQAEALLAAANKIDSLRALLAGQAERMRAEALSLASK